VFELDKPVIETYLGSYLQALSKGKSLGKADFSDGISSFISLMPELALDSPMLHQLLWKNVMKPLVSDSCMQLKFVKFDADIPKKEGEEAEEDDYVFDASDYTYNF